MHLFPLLAGGITTGLLIVLGEAVLNLTLLAGDWAELFARFELPQPGPAVAAQGLLKLLLLGGFAVWLAGVLQGAFPRPLVAAVVAGLIVWFLVWAWVQWGMLLAGYVTPRVALFTVAWGLLELPLAVCAGAAVRRRLQRTRAPA